MNKISVQTIVKKPIELVWQAWTTPEHIKNWCFASDDWTVGDVTNDLQVDGRFKTNMHAKDNSTGFDFEGTYTEVVPLQKISYVMDDGRKVEIKFEQVEGGVNVTEDFDPENENSEELQRNGWQSILDNFKKYTESMN